MRNNITTPGTHWVCTYTPSYIIKKENIGLVR